MGHLHIDLKHYTAALTWRAMCFLLIFASSVWRPKAAHAIDCTALKMTNVPYQLTIRKVGAKSYPVQIYRGEDLTRRQLSMVNNHLFVATFQANFQLKSPGASGQTITIAYDVPTNKYIWAQNARVVHGTSMIDGKPSSGPSFEATYAMLPDDVIVLDKCSFPVKHYTMKQESPSIAMTSDVWFSPELNTFLKTTISTRFASTGETTKVELEASSIETDFTPFR